MRTARLAALAGGVILALRAGRAYWRWQQAEVARLRAGATVARTARGPVEYVIAGDGPPVLLSHGIGGGYDQGLWVAETWGLANVRVVAVSRAGYLRTPLTVGRTPQDMADAYAALLDRLRIDRVAVVGISAGAPAALHFAACHPARCSCVVLVAGVGRALDLPRMARWLQETTRLMYGELWESVAQCLATRWPFVRRLYHGVILVSLVPPAQRRAMLADPMEMERVARLLRTTSPALCRRPGILNDHAQVVSFDPPDFAAITAPVLIVHGREDRLVPYAVAEYLSDVLPAAELLPVDQGGHGFWAPASGVHSRVAAFLIQHAAEPATAAGVGERLQRTSVQRRGG